MGPPSAAEAARVAEHARCPCLPVGWAAWLVPLLRLRGLLSLLLPVGWAALLVLLLRLARQEARARILHLGGALRVHEHSHSALRPEGHSAHTIVRLCLMAEAIKNNHQIRF